MCVLLGFLQKTWAIPIIIVVHDGVTNRCVHSEVASLSYVVLVLVLADTSHLST